VLLLGVGRAWGWGEDGHRIIAEAGWPALRPLLGVGEGELEDFVRACIEPDGRKGVEPGEGARHYVDIERWEDGFLRLARRVRAKRDLVRMYQLGWPISAADVAARFRAAPRRRADYEAWRGVGPSDDDLGTIFYAVADAERALADALAHRDGSAKRRAAGDLCHYWGDLTQPLHNTANYRGQLSGNAICPRHGGSSVHERYESRMVHQFREELARRTRVLLAKQAPTGADAAADPVELAIEHSRRAYTRLQELLNADHAVIADESACPTADGSDRMRALYDATGGMTAEQLADATRLVVARTRHAAGR
jgi:hypothetical protein